MELEIHNVHRGAMQLLETQLGKGMLPHAHLFLGPQGTGRINVARKLASEIFCSGPVPKPCGECPNCRAFMSLEHPDYHEFCTPEGRQRLPIESIRQLQTEASRKPLMGRVRVFVIRDAERMTLEAANCFLKTLEEPPGECYLFLIAAGLHDLPETIASRCQIIKLTGFPPDEVEGELCGEGVDSREASWLAGRSWGSPGKAREFHKCRLYQINEKLIHQLLQLKLESNFEASDFVQNHAKKLGDNASEQRKATQELLECIAMIYRDIALLAISPEAGLFNEHSRQDLIQYAERCDLDSVLECADKTLVALERIGANVNRRMVLDDLFSSLALPGG